MDVMIFKDINHYAEDGIPEGQYTYSEEDTYS